MEIDFYKEFSHYTTVALLIITQEPDTYQSAAIEAAKQLLQGRIITPADREEAEQHFTQKSDTQSAEFSRMNIYKEQITNVLEPVIVPNMPLDPAKWFKLFLWAYGFFYVWILYKVIRTQVYFLHCKDCGGYPSVWGGPINAIFLTIVFFFLLKNKKWAWILLVVSNIIAMITLVNEMQVLYQYRGVLPISSTWVVFRILYPIVFVSFMWRPVIATFFGVNVQSKLRSLWAGLTLGILYFAVLEWVI